MWFFVSVQCQKVPCWNLYLLSKATVVPYWTVSPLTANLFCWTCHFWVGLCFFVYIYFFYLKASPYLVFNMKPGCGSLLSDLTCSVFWRWGGTLKRNTSGICGGAWGGLITLGLPVTNVTCSSWVHTAQPSCWYVRALSQVGRVFHALPSQSGT